MTSRTTPTASPTGHGVGSMSISDHAVHTREAPEGTAAIAIVAFAERGEAGAASGEAGSTRRCQARERRPAGFEVGVAFIIRAFLRGEWLCGSGSGRPPCRPSESGDAGAGRLGAASGPDEVDAGGEEDEQ